MILSQLLGTTTLKNPLRAAFHFLGKDVTYREIQPRIARLSYLYQKEITQPNARVAFLASNCPSFALTFFSLTNLRIPSIPMDPAASDDEIEAWLKSTQATHLAVTNDYTPRARELLQNRRLPCKLVEIEKKQGGEFDASFTPAPDKIPSDKDSILWFRTQGTSEHSKIVMLTHAQLQHAAQSLKSPYHLTPNDRVFTSLNWSHPFAFVHGLLLPLLSGSTCVIDAGTEGPELLDALTQSKTTRLVDQPRWFEKFGALCVQENRIKLPMIQSITVGMGALSKSAKNTLTQTLSLKVATTYGLTEMGWSVSMADAQSPDLEGFERPLPGFKYKVTDENGDTIEGSHERRGQLAVTGPSVMSGYFHTDKDTRDKSTKNAIRGTWLYTQDIVTLRGEGESLSIKFQDRKEACASIDGSIVTPSEVDAVKPTFPGIEDAASFSCKNLLGQKIIACAIVKSPGGSANEKEFLNKWALKLPPSHRPVMCFAVDQIPRDRAGNVLRLRLAREFAGLANAS